MAATGYTPISLYYSTTASAVPTAGNLANGELALNIADMKLYAKNSSGTVTLLASNASTTGVDSLSFGSTGLTPSTATTGAITVAGTLNVANGGTGKTSYTSSGVLYASGTGTLTNNSALTFDGTSSLYVSTSSSNGVVGITGPSSGTNNGASLQIINGAIVTSQIGTYSRVIGGTYNESLAFYNNGNDFVWYSTSERMRLTSTGLGIGTSSPSYALDIYAGTMRLGNSSGSGGTIYFTRSGQSDAARVACDASSNLQFYTGGSERGRFSSAGGFSVGTTANPGTGAIYATGAITAFYSDKRLKTVSGKIENALDKVGQLSGVYYTNNDTAKSFGYDSDEVQVGVIAQEVEAVLPQVVKAAPFDLDENGNSKSGENYKTVQYDKLAPLLIEAINELRAEVTALKGTI